MIAIACSSGSPSPLFAACFADCTAVGELRATFSAISSAASMSFSGAYTSLTRPMQCTSCASSQNAASNRSDLRALASVAWTELGRLDLALVILAYHCQRARCLLCLVLAVEIRDYQLLGLVVCPRSFLSAFRRCLTSTHRLHVGVSAQAYLNSSSVVFARAAIRRREMRLREADDYERCAPDNGKTRREHLLPGRSPTVVGSAGAD